MARLPNLRSNQLARSADHDPPLWCAKMAGYAFGSNPPYGLRVLSGAATGRVPLWSNV